MRQIRHVPPGGYPEDKTVISLNVVRGEPELCEHCGARQRVPWKIHVCDNIKHYVVKKYVHTNAKLDWWMPTALELARKCIKEQGYDEENTLLRFEGIKYRDINIREGS